MWRSLILILALKTLFAGPRFDQRAVYAEMLIRSRSLARACSSTCAKNFAAISPSSSRSRFLLNTVATQAGSSMFNPTNQRNSRLYSSFNVSFRQRCGAPR
jgi:hypothetical protein